MIYYVMKGQEMSLVDELREYRLKNKISIQRLADMLDVKYLTVHRWFKDIVKPNEINKYGIKRLLEK